MFPVIAALQAAKVKLRESAIEACTYSAISALAFNLASAALAQQAGLAVQAVFACNMMLAQVVTFKAKTALIAVNDAAQAAPHAVEAAVEQ